MVGDLPATRLTPNERRRGGLESAAREVFSALADRVLAFDGPAAMDYGELTAERERGGTPLNGFGGQIAAICRVHGATLATRNTRDFEHLGLPVVDPWDDAA